MSKEEFLWFNHKFKCFEYLNLFPQTAKKTAKISVP